MALALRFDGLVRSGAVRDYAELARLGHVTRARLSQIMNLLYLAPDLQEAILFLPRTERGRDRLVLRDLLPIASVPDWKKQRRHALDGGLELVVTQRLEGLAPRNSVSPPRPSGACAGHAAPDCQERMTHSDT
jgi:hypothetical protein